MSSWLKRLTSTFTRSPPGEFEREPVPSQTATSSIYLSLCDAEIQCVLQFLPWRDRLHAAHACRQLLHAASSAVAWKHLDAQHLVVPADATRNQLLRIENGLLRHVPMSMTITPHHYPDTSVVPLWKQRLGTFRWHMFRVPNVVTHLTIDMLAHRETWMYLITHPRVQPSLRTLCLQLNRVFPVMFMQALIDEIRSDLPEWLGALTRLETIRLEYEACMCVNVAAVCEHLFVPTLTTLELRPICHSSGMNRVIFPLRPVQMSTLMHLSICCNGCVMDQVYLPSMPRLESLRLEGVCFDTNFALSPQFAGMPRLHTLAFGWVAAHSDHHFELQLERLPAITHLFYYVDRKSGWDVTLALIPLMWAKPHVCVTVWIDPSYYPMFKTQIEQYHHDTLQRIELVSDVAFPSRY